MTCPGCKKEIKEVTEVTLCYGKVALDGDYLSEVDTAEEVEQVGIIIAYECPLCKKELPDMSGKPIDMDKVSKAIKYLDEHGFKP